MKNIFSALVSLTLLGSLSMGCGNAVDAAPIEVHASEACVRDGQAGDHEYVFSAGSSQIARVERSIRDDGSETLSGVTNSSRGTLTEYAELDADGRLTYADAMFVGKNGAKRRVLVDAAHGAYFVQDAQGAGWHRQPKDAPWVLADITDEEGTFLIERSPVSAWVTARAARVSSNLRVIDVKLRGAVVAAADQFVIDGDAGERFVVTRSSTVIANDEFITVFGDDVASSPSRVVNASLRPRRTAQR